jgi:tetratricopeptide (TPR) repeat protein
VAQGHFDAASNTLDSFARKAPASPALLAMRARLALAQGDYAAGTRMFTQLRAAQRTSPGWQARTSLALARVSRLTGRIKESERLLRESLAASEARAALGDYVDGAVQLGFLELDFHNRPDSAMAILAGALAKHPLAAIPAPDRPYPALVVFYAKLGKSDQARRLWHEYETAVPAAVRRGNPFRYFAAATLAEAEGHPDEAAVQYRKWYDESGDCNVCGLFDLARLADRAGRTDSAIALYDRGLATPSLERFVLDAYELPPALKRSGELYEAKGDRAKAADRYRRFVDLWKDADPELQPGVREVRARLARLSTEPGA